MQKRPIVFFLSLLFIALAVFGIVKEHEELLAIPLGLGVIWLSLKRLDILLFLIVLCTPLSLNLEDLELGGIGFYFPTEPLLFGVLLIFLVKLFSGKAINPEIYKHPISIFIYVYLGWILITSLNSEMPLVSFKFLLAKLWFIGPMYFLMVHLFQKRANMEKFIFLFLISMLVVIMYTVFQHSTFGFDKESGHVVMKPFFKDHTVYGAVVALILPVTFGRVITPNKSLLMRTFYLSALVIVVVGLIFSYTRAAWVSVIGAAAVFFIMWMRIKLNLVLGTFAVLLTFFLLFQDQILINLERNEQDSSDNLTEHVESISNVSTDASNLERLNRWNSALAMWEKRPIFGWGPGTYQFVYAPFQSSADLTIISTNNADQGNAHSEYLGPLSEQGVPGMALILVLAYMISALAFRLYFTLGNRDLRILVVTVYLGLVTYFTHGIVNNYLDTDKASVPFWGFIAMLVAVDLFHRKKSVSSDMAAQ